MIFTALKFDLFRDSIGWHWRLRHRGAVVALSLHGYQTPNAAENAWRALETALGRGARKGATVPLVKHSSRIKQCGRCEGTGQVHRPTMGAAEIVVCELCKGSGRQ